MTSYILLERIKVEDANCIAGFTYGFPAITHFLGFTHALSRKFKDKFNITLPGCAVFCHDYQLHTKDQFEPRFVQSKNPPVILQGHKEKAHKPPPIIEEGKMDMTVSLLLQCDGMMSGQDHIQQQYKENFLQWVYSSRLAGGTIHRLHEISFFNDNVNLNKIKRKLLPSFVLFDATTQLQKYVTDSQSSNPTNELFNLWTDFFACKKIAKHNDDNPEQVEWIQKPKPNARGWFVPLMIGYKGISPLYDPLELEHNRDIRYPFRFVESVYSIGEWRGMHRLQNLDDIIWRYHIEDEWYLCRQTHSSNSKVSEPHLSIEDDFINDEFNFLNNLNNVVGE